MTSQKTKMSQQLLPFAVAYPMGATLVSIRASYMRQRHIFMFADPAHRKTKRSVVQNTFAPNVACKALRVAERTYARLLARALPAT